MRCLKINVLQKLPVMAHFLQIYPSVKGRRPESRRANGREGTDDMSQAGKKDTEQIAVYTRRSPRYQTTLLVRVNGEASMRECRGNVSAGGFCFEGPGKLDPGTRVEVLFRVPGAGVWLQARGVVLGCVEGSEVTANRGRFTLFELGDTRLLEGWFDMIHRQQTEGYVDDPDEKTLFSLTVS